jgi:phosphoribosyl-ATP pyrophosphohydrolase/phosphoribosyl-AMP cyclohydrolase
MIDFTKSDDGLIPAIIQDSRTQKILMLGYMNQEAYERTKEEKRVTFYSRSRKRLWTKGEESGNFLTVVNVLIDCDNDTLLIKVLPEGPVCHTGNDTCFNETNVKSDFLYELEEIICQRKQNKESGSYVSGLFSEGINKIAQKVGEEAIELIIEAKDNDDQRFLNEASDLLFHYLVLLSAKNNRLSEVIEVLKARHERASR